MYIGQLTSEYQSLLPVYRDKWIEIGLSAEPCNQAAAEQAVLAAYRQARVNPPKRFVWCDSPAALVSANTKEVSGSVKEQVWDAPMSQAWILARQLVDPTVWDRAWATIGVPIRESVWDVVRVSLNDAVDGIGQGAIYGPHDAHLLGFYDYLINGLRLDCDLQIKPLMNAAMACGWWVPRDGICLMSERIDLTTAAGETLQFQG